MVIKILLVEDHSIVRSGLRSLISAQADMKVVGEAADGRACLALVDELSPDVVIMDIAMPGLNGIEATRRIVAQSPKTKVIALSAHMDRNLVSATADAGAKAYVLKQSAFEHLCRAVRAVVSGKLFVDEALAGALTVGNGPDHTAHLQTAFKLLSPREREVLQLLAEGKATKEAAAKLGISVKTVETYRAKLMEKLQLDSVAELTKYAVREGITSLEFPSPEGTPK